VTVGAGLALAAALGSLATPPTMAAHVNRTVGPYTILVVLVEEPFFATNHAGFEFWVSDAAGYVAGLDKSVAATATAGSQSEPLAVSTETDRHSYVIDRNAVNVPFDPGRGGAWTLELRGNIEGLAIDESFDTTFPAYPRVASGQPVPSVVSPAQADATTPLLPIAGLIFASFAVVRIVRGNMSPHRPSVT
jgi:hypothetical protein